MKLAHTEVAQVVVEPVDLPVSPESAVVSFSCATAAAILESSAPASGYARFSIFACDPVDAFVHDHGDPGCPIRNLARHTAKYPPVLHAPVDLPFPGGWIGFLTYEAGLGIERISPTTRRDVPLPLASFNLYDAAAVYDHLYDRWYLLAVDWPASVGRDRRTVSARLKALRTMLVEAPPVDRLAPLPDVVAGAVAPNMSREAYFTKVRCTQRYIEAGDIYEVNLTRRFTTQTDVSPLTLYRRLRRISPSSHAALLPGERFTILSSSPELFLRLRCGHVLTRPIKGTRPRANDPGLDALYRRELIESEKERAELTMIIDLLRNDLGRVCAFGSIRVERAWEIEEHPTVFHQVATIAGDLEPGRDWVDLLHAAFPGGSITGAPKIRAMQIIDELEPTTRGVYCGSIGMIGLDGSLCLNVAIRTMVQTANVVHVYAGGAIVADSTPEQEYDEITAKASGMLRALGGLAPVARPTFQEATVS